MAHAAAPPSPPLNTSSSQALGPQDGLREHQRPQQQHLPKVARNPCGHLRVRDGLKSKRKTINTSAQCAARTSVGREPWNQQRTVPCQSLMLCNVKAKQIFSKPAPTRARDEASINTHRKDECSGGAGGERPHGGVLLVCRPAGDAQQDLQTTEGGSMSTIEVAVLKQTRFGCMGCGNSKSENEKASDCRHDEGRN